MSSTKKYKSKSDSSDIRYRKQHQYSDITPTENFSDISISTPKSITETVSDTTSSSDNKKFTSDVSDAEEIIEDEKAIEEAIYKISKIINKPKQKQLKDKKDSNILTAEKLISILKENKPALPASNVSHATESKIDLSDEVKLIVNKYGKEGDYRFATFVGNVGGVSSRKIMECPNCKEKFLVSRGFNKTAGKVDRRAGARSNKQLAWIDFLNELGKTELVKGKSRGEIMKIGSELRKKGITIDQINSSKFNIN